MSGTDDAVPSPDLATLTDEALIDEIRSNQRTERRLLVLAGLVAAASTAVVLILHGPIS